MRKCTFCGSVAVHFVTVAAMHHCKTCGSVWPADTLRRLSDTGSFVGVNATAGPFEDHRFVWRPAPPAGGGR